METVVEMEERFVDEKEVSRLTGLAVQTLRNWRFRGEGFPYSKIGKAVRYSIQDVYEYMDSKRIKPEG